MLTNVVIINHIQVDLILWVAFSCGIVVTVVTWTKDGLYCD
jgi:hypothetical protein